MRYLVWVRTMDKNLKENTFKKDFQCDGYPDPIDARTAAIEFGEDYINKKSPENGDKWCSIDIIGTLIDENEILILSKKFDYCNNSVISNGPLSPNEILSNLIKEREIYKEKGLDIKVIPVRVSEGFIIPTE